MKPLHIKINKPKEEFKYGSCAIIAISSAFNINRNALVIIMRLLKYKYWAEGLDFYQLKRIINTLDIGREWTYTPNPADIRYWQLVGLFKDRNIIVMFSEHLSYVEKGEIFDEYIYNSGSAGKKEWINGKPTGWWIKR